jgi:hypothetical protein
MGVWSKYSCGAAVVPEYAAEAFSTTDATSPTGLKRGRGWEEQNVVLALVVAFFVIMLSELSDRFPQRSFPEQDQVRQTLLFDRSHPALRKSVQIRAARRKSQTLHAACRQGLRNSAQNLASRSCKRSNSRSDVPFPQRSRCKLPDASSMHPDDL